MLGNIFRLVSPALGARVGNGPRLPTLFRLLVFTTCTHFFSTSLYAAPSSTVAPLQAKGSLLQALESIIVAPTYEGAPDKNDSVSIDIGNGELEVFTAESVGDLYSEPLPFGFQAFHIFNNNGEGSILVDNTDVYISIWDLRGNLKLRITPALKDPTGQLYDFQRGPFITTGICASEQTELTSEANADLGASNLKIANNLRSSPLTLPNRRILRLAVNLDKSYFDFYHKDNLGPAENLVLQANLRFFSKDLNIWLLPSFFSYPNEDLDEQTSADKFVGRPGIFSFDIGHLFRGFWLGTGVGGSAEIGTVCGRGGDIKKKGVAYTVASIAASMGPVDFERNFAHEIGHQLGLFHSFSECPGGDLQFRNSRLEAADGASVMGYSGRCNFSTGDSPSIQATQFSQNSIEQVAEILRVMPSCGERDSKSLSFPGFDTSLDARVPYRTRFSIPVTIKEPLRNSTRLSAESLIRLPEVFDFRARLQPIAATNRTSSELRYPAGATLRIDFPSYGFSDEKICNGGERKWGAAGCFGKIDRVYQNPFAIKLDHELGAVSSVKFPIEFQGEYFGFADNYLAEQTFVAGSTLRIQWNVGGGSIASRVALYFVYPFDYGLNQTELIDNQTLLPGTFGKNYRIISESLPNIGSAEIKLPKLNRLGFLLLLPVTPSNAPPFIFWSRSELFRLKCGTSSRRGTLGEDACPIGQICECEEDTPTPLATPTATPTGVPASATNTPLPTATPVTSRTPTPPPGPTPTSTPLIAATPTPCTPVILAQYPCKAEFASINMLAYTPPLTGCNLADTLGCDHPDFVRRCQSVGGNALQILQEPPGSGLPWAGCVEKYSDGTFCNWAHASCYYLLTRQCIQDCSSGGAGAGGGSS